jgi:hypothetical protein
MGRPIVTFTTDFGTTPTISCSRFAASFAVSSTGAFAHIETHELVEASELAGLLSQAASLTYTPPGE